MARKVIPPDMIPEEASEVVEVDGKRYLQTNEAMFTFYRRTKGEFSDYFLGLMERKVILAARCPVCELVRVPPFMLYCPECDFAELEQVEVADTGVMNSTPPITYFGSSMFQHQVPYGRGRVLLDGADTALPVNVYTTTGVLTPRTFSKGTRVKLVFRDEREGKPTDMFAVPLEEIPEHLREKAGLQERDLPRNRPAEPALPEPTDEARRAYQSTLSLLQDMTERIASSERAMRDLAGWRKRIHVKMPGGSLALEIDDGTLTVSEGAPATADFSMVVLEDDVLAGWINLRGSLTNSIIAGTLWIDRNEEFITMFKLDRLPRSISRTQA